jgi:hypothetical protein
MFQKIANDPARCANQFYPKQRLISTISCFDCDDISKVPFAGEIFKVEEKEYQLMHNGIKMYKDCYYREDSSWMTDIIYGFSGHHEPPMVST